MRYERSKQLAALLSLLSVAAALTVTSDLLGVVRSGTDLVMIGTVAATVSAGFAALISLYWSRRLAFEREKQRIFIIYSKADLDVAQQLAIDLRERGFSPWLDVEEITPGQVWRKAILSALEESVAALLLVSPNLEQSGFVLEELKVALSTLQEFEPNVSPVIPVRLADVPVPQELAHVSWVDLFDPNGPDRLETGLRRIVSARKRAKEAPAPGRQF